MSHSSKIRKTVLLSILLMSLFVVGFVYKVTQPRILSVQDLRNNGMILFQQARAISPFILTDDEGNPFDNESLDGKWTLIFPGFTHCPDICPATLSILKTYWDSLSANEQRTIQVVLLTLDPTRDTTKQLHQYVNYFDESFIGINANLADTFTFASQLNIAFTMATAEQKRAGNYNIDHSANIAVVNPQGQYQAFIKPPFNPSQLQLVIQTAQKIVDG